MERYIYFDNKIIVFIITDPVIEETIKNKETKQYKVYNITRVCNCTKIIKIYDFHTKEEFKKYGSQNRKYILYDNLNTDYINYRERYEYYTSIDSLISHNYEKIYKDKQITGFYKKYSKEGDLIEEYYHNNFLKEGEYKVYNENGILILNEYYINGIRNGVSMEYNDNGNLILKINYNNGEKIESIEYVYNNENIIENKNKKFENNKLIYESYTHKNGETYEYNFLNLKKNGNYGRTYLKNNNFIIESGIYKDNIIINCIKKIKDTDIILYEKKTENDIIHEKDYTYKNEQYYLNYEYIETNINTKKINYSSSGKITRFEEINEIDNEINNHIIKEYKSDKLIKYNFQILKKSILLMNIELNSENINDNDINKYLKMFIQNKQ